MGTYSVVLLLPWEGQAQVFVRLEHSSEVVQILKNTGSLHSHAATIMATLKDQDPIKKGSVK